MITNIIKYLVISILLFNGNNKDLDMKNQIEEVLYTVKTHNLAWSELADISEQEKYIHDDIVFIAPLYKAPIEGKVKYLKDYESFNQRATVHYLEEVDPKVRFYNNGQTAIVTYEIDMFYDFGDISNSNWKGIDIMTLVRENDRWLIVSDMYAKQVEND